MPIQDERRTTTLREFWTILAGGDLEPGDRMSITSTIAKSDDFLKAGNLK